MVDLEETHGARYPQQVQQKGGEGVRSEGGDCSLSPLICTQGNPLFRPPQSPFHSSVYSPSSPQSLPVISFGWGEARGGWEPRALIYPPTGQPPPSLPFSEQSEVSFAEQAENTQCQVQQHQFFRSVMILGPLFFVISNIFSFTNSTNGVFFFLKHQPPSPCPTICQI